jgi:ATP-dependent DNA helicase RecQ
MGIELTSVQRDAVESVLAGRDTLLVSPTGSGKSAVYQVAGALLDGTTVIVSPLIALQEDQLAGLADLGIGEAVAVHSAGPDRARRRALRQVARGQAEFVLLGPEQLASAHVRDVLSSVTIDRFIVDEAHCVDAWGPDFRPDYAALGWMRAELGDPPVLALTATAAPHVREEICRVLRMRAPEIVVAGAERRNIDLAVHAHPDTEGTRAAVVHDALTMVGTGLVYVPTRRATEELAAALTQAGRAAATYHAGMSARSRAATLERFRSGADVVVVATSAFGLGVDAPHVRFVLHLDAPETIDAYYQEVGRAGRDGDPAVAALHHTTGRSSRRRFAAGASVPTVELCTAIAASIPAALDDTRRAVGATKGTFLQAVRMLERHGVVSVDAGMLVAGPTSFAGVEPDIAAALVARQALLETRAGMMTAYLESDACRWATITGYLDHCEVASCGHCDWCRHHGARRGGAAAQRRVRHDTFGDGTVLTEDDDVMLVLFDTAGYRRLSPAVLAEEGLLEPIP